VAETCGLIERETHIAALDGWFKETVAGNGRMVFIGGEAGIGKSSLAERFAQRMHGRARVLRGACDMLSTPRPLGPLLDFGAIIGGKFDRVLNSGVSRDQMFRAALDEFSEGLTPTVAIIEDAHWADEATLDLLRFLGRRLDPMRILLIVTYRDDEVGPNHPLRVALGDLATATATRRLTLEPLSVEGISRLVSRCPDTPNLDPVALHAMTGGNPFFASEALFAGAFTFAEIPTTVRDAVLARASRLSWEAIEVLETAAVIGSPIPDALLSDVVGQAISGFEECLATGMLVSAGDHAVAFRHELARIAIYESIRPMRRRELHACVLARLRTMPAFAANVALLAHHADAAVDREAVLCFGLEAAQRAVAVKAHREAAAQYARVVRYWSELPAEARAAHLEDYSYEQFLTGEIDHSIALRLEAIAIWRASGNRVREGNALRGISRLYWYAGKNSESIAAADEAVSILEEMPAGPELAKALSFRSQLYMLATENEPAIAWGHRAMDLAQELDDIGTYIHALINVGTARMSLEGVSARTTLERGLAMALEEDLDDHATRAFINLAWSAIHSREFENAGDYLERGIAYAADRDLDSPFLYLISCRSHMRLLMGDWAAALADADLILSRPKVAAISRITALKVRGLIWARRGESGVLETLEEALELAIGTGEVQRLRPVRTAIAEAAWLAGDRERALAEIQAIRALTDRVGSNWDVGEVELWARRVGAPESKNLPVPIGCFAEPLRFGILGDWRSSAAAWEALNAPYDQALALLDGDECALRDALAIFQQLGARTPESIVARRLRQLGVRGIPRGPRATTRANPANLTARELDVLPYLIEGKQNIEIANRLFLSAKTVEHHIGSIFSKLGVHSRTEVTGAAARLGLELALRQDRAAD
jgi:DNA-binding CsgD family transcriptional regulator